MTDYPTQFILGLLAHLFADWMLQNDWQATHKTDLRHPAAWVHFGCHLACMLIVWGFVWPAFVVPVTHALIDTRKPLVWWRTLIGQKQVNMGLIVKAFDPPDGSYPSQRYKATMPSDIASAFGWNVAAMQVAFWQDQAAHILMLGIFARFA